MICHIEEAGLSTDPSDNNYSNELGACIDEIKFIRNHLNDKIGGQNTYCLQKANM